MRYLNLGFVGYGVVGEATAHSLRENAEGEPRTIRHFDLDPGKTSHPLEEVVRASDFIFMCVPTPSTENGRIDLSIMDENMAAVEEHARGTDKIVVIKSTVVPGTARIYAKYIYPGVNICSNPEFLTEANAMGDAENPDRVVIGADSSSVSERVAHLYRRTFPDVPIFQTDLTTAEMAKYAANGFLATKVVFGNEIHGLCGELGISYEDVRRIVVADRRIGETHLDVTEEGGFGGTCFPKDLAALLHVFKNKGVDATLLDAVQKKNRMIRGES